MKEWLACDVSEYQGRIDFETLRSHTDAVIVRLGYIGNSECCLDELWERNADECTLGKHYDEHQGVGWSGG